MEQICFTIQRPKDGFLLLGGGQVSVPSYQFSFYFVEKITDPMNDGQQTVVMVCRKVIFESGIDSADYSYLIIQRCEMTRLHQNSTEAL